MSKQSVKTAAQVRYGSKKRIKGLEFIAVALITDADYVEKKSGFTGYVAATHAREHLLHIRLSG